MKILFVGNRRFVLEEIQKKNLDCEVLVIKNTHLEKDVILKNFKNFRLVSSKEELLEIIKETEFDIFLSNGCPFILPIKDLKPKKYVNIHPSFLPDLKGIDPVLGAIKFSRDAGATCHVMNERIDEGPIISRDKIPFTKDLNSTILYQLSFIAEKNVFNKAYELKFEAQEKQEKGNWIYYSRKQTDRNVDLNENVEKMIQNIKAFGNKSLGCFFGVNNLRFKVFCAEEIYNPYLVSYAKKFDDLEVIFAIEDIIIFKVNERVLKFNKVEGQTNLIKQRDRLVSIK